MNFNVSIFINGARLDTFDDESINIEASVQNIRDIGKIFNEFSQAFTVPASARNNRIFRHFYNADIDGGFDARIRHTAFIWVESLSLRIGTIRMDGVKLTKKKPEFYKISFIGNMADLNEAIGDDYLSSLDLSAYDFTYSSANVVTGLISGLSGGNIVFPLISTDKQYLYNSDIADITNQERLENIAWNGSGSVHGVNWTSLRPALKVMRILEAIETKYGITFSRDFLGNVATEELRLWLANKDTSESLENSVRVIDYNSINTNYPQFGTFNNGTGAYVVSDGGGDYVRNVNVDVESSDGKVYTLQVMNNDTILGEQTGSGNMTVDVPLPSGVPNGSQIYARILATAGKVVELVDMEIATIDWPLFPDNLVDVTRTDDITLTTVEAGVAEFVPAMKVKDFLKSFFKFFNLTIEPTSDTSFTVKQLDEWYNDGNIYDISKYVDEEEMFVDRPEIFREIMFKFQEPSTILAEQFFEFNNVAYGDLETKLKDATGKNLDGDEYEIKLAFEQMVYEKILDQNDNSETNIVYGLSLNKSLSESIPKGHLLYTQLISVNANPISLVNDTSTKQLLNGSIFMPSHVNNTNKDFSTVFGSEINEHDGATIQNSAYELYYKDYITDSFSIKRRSFKITLQLPLWLMIKLRLNDRLIINGRRYIINQYTLDITTGEGEFELLNDIYGAGSNDGSTQQEEESGSDENDGGGEIINDPRPEEESGTSFDISSASSPTANGSCQLAINNKKYWDGAEALPTLSDVIYNEEELTTVFNGGNNYYKMTSEYSIRISATGVVLDVYFCSQGEGGGSA